jgi:hypothetical protein
MGMKKIKFITLILGVFLFLAGCGVDEDLKNGNYDSSIPSGQALVVVTIKLQKTILRRALIGALILSDFTVTITGDDFDEPVVKDLQISQDENEYGRTIIFIPASEGFSRCLVINASSNYEIDFISDKKCFFAQSQEIIFIEFTMRPFD